MATNSYDVGDLVRISVAFTDADGTAADPTTTTCKYTDPSGTTTTKTQADSEVVKDSTGNYHLDITIDEHGKWKYRWAGTGSVVAAGEGWFNVRDSQFD